MNRYAYTLASLVLSSGLVLGQQSYPAQPQETAPASREQHEHLSKKQKKELKKERDRERKEEKERRKREAKERKKYDKDREQELAKERKQDRDHDRKNEDKEIAKRRKKEDQDRNKEDKEIAKDRHEDRAREERHQDRDISRDADQPSMAGRAAGAVGSVVTAPFHIARYATPRLLRAQKDVSRAIYTALPASNVAVLLNDAGQIVLRGSAPTPSLRSRLLQLAMGAAGGYPIVDQLAANFVGDAAGAATDAAIGGVSGLIHGRPNDNSNNAGAYGPPPQNSAPPSSAALEPGSSACVNVSGAQVVLTGQAASQAGADLLREFGRQLVGPNATLNDQLAARTNGTAAPAGQASVPVAPPPDDTLSAALAPGSTVCVNVSDSNEVLLTGTVASASELSAVERAAQPLVAGARLHDELTIGTVTSGQQVAGTAPAAGESAESAVGSGVASAAGGAGANASGTAQESVPAEENSLEQALHAIPRLSNVDATVLSASVQLTGSVDTTQDEQMARDIARQQAPGMSIIDNISVAGRPPQQP